MYLHLGPDSTVHTILQICSNLSGNQPNQIEIKLAKIFWPHLHNVDIVKFQRWKAHH